MRASSLPMRTAMYLRDRSDEVVAEQRESCERLIAEHPEATLELLERPYADIGAADDMAERPALTRLLADAAAGRFEVLLIPGFAQLHSNEAALVQALHTLVACDVTIVAVGDRFATDATLHQRLFPAARS